MGGHGSDVAREASGIVLLDDDFSSIVAAVRLGRRIFDNIKKAMTYTIGVHVPIAGIAIIPILLGWPIFLYPVHIVFLELIIDPVCSIVFESEQEEPNVMKRPPRGSKTSLFNKELLGRGIMQGIFSLIIIVAVFKLALVYGYSDAQARTLGFVVLIASNLCLIVVNRSFEKNFFKAVCMKNSALLYVVVVAFVFLWLVLYTPYLQKLFYFGTINITAVVAAMLCGVLSVILFDFLKNICSKSRIKSA
jgi:Ca2+-transporting ATPase